jgi:tetratricopeptide (TPR) repeat protein
VLRRLYLDSSRFKGVASIPADVRYLLVDDVLEMPDIPLASELMLGLDTAPTGVAADAWQLKRAHVFILGGDPDAGVAALKQLLSAQKDPAPATVTAAGAKPATPVAAPVDADDVLQVLFDLQTLHRDKDAIPFFETLLSEPLVPEQRRQMLYWTADSYKALADYSKAAELYLRSAMLLDPYSMDQWAQTARYQAAQMLAKAGYIDDARNLYKGLLNATRDPSQQAVLQHDLQQLMLMPTARH